MMVPSGEMMETIKIMIVHLNKPRTLLGAYFSNIHTLLARVFSSEKANVSIIGYNYVI